IPAKKLLAKGTWRRNQPSDAAWGSRRRGGREKITTAARTPIITYSYRRLGMVFVLEGAEHGTALPPFSMLDHIRRRQPLRAALHRQQGIAAGVDDHKVGNELPIAVLQLHTVDEDEDPVIGQKVGQGRLDGGRAGPPGRKLRLDDGPEPAVLAVVEH